MSEKRSATRCSVLAACKVISIFVILAVYYTVWNNEYRHLGYIPFTVSIHVECVVRIYRDTIDMEGYQ